MNKLFCISGFLGLAADWDFLKPLAAEGNFEVSAYAPQEFLSEDFEKAAEKINAAGKKAGSDVLVGYSLGGRLAMQALTQAPEQWKGAIFISAHPGLEDEKDISERGESDIRWAKKFLDMPWSEILGLWNAQSIFQGSLLQREENSFKREELADLLTYFSLGQQEDLRPKLKNISKPILFIAGEKDKKFSKLAKELNYLNVEDFEMWLVPDTGHRVLGAGAQIPQVIEKIKNFLEDHL